MELGDGCFMCFIGSAVQADGRRGTALLAE